MEIILLRHGRPTGAINPKLSAAGFAGWVRNYNRSKVDPKSLPAPDLGPALRDYFIVASDLARSIDSVYISVNRAPDLTLRELREMAIPCYKLPFCLKAYTWLVLSRIFWMAGFSGKVESFKSAKMRAKLSAERLQELAKQHDKVVFFGHGMLNKYIAKELNKLGWNSVSAGKTYWGMTKLII